MSLFEDTKYKDKDNENENMIFHSLNAIRSMEVIDINTGEKVGFIKDLVVDIEDSKIVSLILPGDNKGWFSKEDDIEISWDRVKKAGVDVILIDSSDFEKNAEENNV